MKFRLGLLCVLCTCSVMLASASGTAFGDTGVGSGAPVIQNDNNNYFQVGQDLDCNADAVVFTDPGADGSPQITDYEWYRDSVSVGNLIGAAAGSELYTPTAADAGHTLICEVTGSDGTTPDATVDSAATPTIQPEATVTLTQYSANVSGNVGEAVSGVTAHLSLLRDGVQVASAAPTTNSSGHWSTTLSQAFGAQDDILNVSYTGTNAPPAASYTSSFGGNDDATISPDGTAVAVSDFAGCANESVIVDGTPNGTALNSGGDCLLTG